MNRNSELLAEIVDRIAKGWSGLPDKPEETPASTARALWFLAAGDPRPVAGSGEALPDLDPDRLDRLHQLVSARLEGVPLAYLTGRQSFMGLELLAEPHAMVPRKETELLGTRALECLETILAARDEARVLDVCTGSGNLAVALAVREPRCTVIGGDLIPGAVNLARRNAERYRVADRVCFFTGDLFEPLESSGFHGSVDLIVANPPYITSAKVDKLPREIGKYEPRTAFDGGPLGLGIVLRILRAAPRFLRPHGHLCMEVGAGQAEPVLRLLERNPHYVRVEGIPDGGGQVRVISALAAQGRPAGAAQTAQAAES